MHVLHERSEGQPQIWFEGKTMEFHRDGEDWVVWEWTIVRGRALSEREEGTQAEDLTGRKTGGQ